MDSLGSQTQWQLIYGQLLSINSLREACCSARCCARSSSAGPKAEFSRTTGPVYVSVPDISLVRFSMIPYRTVDSSALRSAIVALSLLVPGSPNNPRRIPHTTAHRVPGLLILRHHDDRRTSFEQIKITKERFLAAFFHWVIEMILFE
jgi:hypothetical protein